MSPSTCRWGILGAAFIARKNWQAIREAGNATLVAVASRDLARARAFIDECQAQVPHPAVPQAMDSYEALLARTDIDAVYIPLPTGIRKEWVIRAAQAGKHVVFLVSGDVDHGSDEVSVLEQHGFAVDIVPGIVGETARPFPFMSRDDIASEMLRAAS